MIALEGKRLGYNWPMKKITPQRAIRAKKTGSKVDGRRTRGETNRRRIVAALSDLIREGLVAPSADLVAARAGVGLRSVFRHFADMETLYREIASDLDQLFLPSIYQRLEATGWRERLMEGLEVRAKVFEDLMPFHVASEVHRHESPFLDEQQIKSTKLQRELLQHLLPAEIVADKTLFEALSLALSMESWLRLRREQRLSKAAAKRVLLLTAIALVTGVAIDE